MKFLQESKHTGEKTGSFQYKQELFHTLLLVSDLY
jgi:hypothetical protein